MSKDKASKKPMPPPVAFGSCPGGRGNAGQSKAHPSPESAPEESSSAGAHAAISTNENGAETPGRVRTDGAQVRREDLDPELMELCEAVRKQLADIFAKIEGLDFQQTRERLIGKCREFRQYVEGAQPGHEFDDTLPLRFETCWLARRLGFGVGPVAVTHTHESMGEFHKRMGLRLELPPGPVSEAKVDIHLATAYLPYGGRNLTLPIAMYQEREGKLVGVAHEPLLEENRRKLLGRFDKWITAAGNCLPSDFRPDVRPAKIDYLNAMVIHSSELKLLWHAPKAASNHFWGRVILLAVLLLILESGATAGACYWGEGKNWLQKINACRPLFVYAFGIVALVAPFILGKATWVRVKRRWKSARGEAQ